MEIEIRKYVDAGFHTQEMEMYLADETKECLLALDEMGKICGMVGLSLRNVVDGGLTSRVGYTEGIYVEPSMRGQGISRLLLNHAEA